MSYFIQELRLRNEPLFLFGLACTVLAAIFIVLSRFSTIEVSGSNAWLKPFKFAISIAIYCWTMGWFCAYLKDFNLPLFNWTIIGLLGFEIIYIGLQAGRGQLSHFNNSSPLYAGLYAAMGIAASLVALYTAYVGFRFFAGDFPELPIYYVWGIRLGIALFVIFSFEGAVMGGRMSHTIGGADAGDGIPILNWSKKFGDPRIAHFVGMHALQILPLLAYYLLKNTRLTIATALLYGALAVFTLVQALQGKPFHKI